MLSFHVNSTTYGHVDHKFSKIWTCVFILVLVLVKKLWTCARRTNKIKKSKTEKRKVEKLEKAKKIEVQTAQKAELESLPCSRSAVQDYERNFNVVSWMQKTDAITIHRVNENLKYPFCIGMMNINGGINISMMIRQAVIYGCQDVFLFGRKSFDRRGAVGAHNYINITHNSLKIEEKKEKEEIKSEIGTYRTVKNNDPIDAALFLKTIQDHKLIPIFVEQGGILINKISWGVMAAKTKNWNKCDEKERSRYCFIFGNEGQGINADILALSKQIPGSFILSLPQHSLLRSLNVAMACSIILHEFYSHVIFGHTIGKFTDP